MPEPFTIRIFVPDGDPESVWVVNQMNWTGVGLKFPRDKWPIVRQRAETDRPGVYVLVGYPEQESDDRKMIYVGQADVIRNRVEDHLKNKGFWEWAIVFVSSAGALNTAHVKWIEHKLLQRADKAGRCILDNANLPNQPPLNEAEMADTKAFLDQVLQILPLVGLREFESVETVAAGPSTMHRPESAPLYDTVIVPAKADGFRKVFIGQNCWYAIRIGPNIRPFIHYIAAYQTRPVSAITHVAEVARIESYGDGGKFRLIFKGPATEIEPIPFGEAPPGSLQGPRYTTKDLLGRAKTVTDLF